MAAFSASLLKSSHPYTPCLSSFSQTLRRKSHFHLAPIRAVKSTDQPEKAQTKTQDSSSSTSTNAQPSTAPKSIPKKPVYSMKKGQIVRVDKDKYLNSVNYLSVGHPPYYKGLDYIYEDRGEVLDLRIFETGEHALVIRGVWYLVEHKLSSRYALIKGVNLVKILNIKQVSWVGVPTAPAWLPTDMLIKSEKLDYERL